MAKSGNQKEVDTPYELVLKNDQVTITDEGIAGYSRTPSSFTIYMHGDNGRCAIHFLNFKAPPVKGTYDVARRDELSLSAVCAFDDTETEERLISESGVFTLTDDPGEILKGHFDFGMTGSITGEKYRLTGNVEATRESTDFRY